MLLQIKVGVHYLFSQLLLLAAKMLIITELVSCCNIAELIALQETYLAKYFIDVITIFAASLVILNPIVKLLCSVHVISFRLD